MISSYSKRSVEDYRVLGVLFQTLSLRSCSGTWGKYHLSMSSLIYWVMPFLLAACVVWSGNVLSVLKIKTNFRVFPINSRKKRSEIGKERLKPAGR